MVEIQINENKQEQDVTSEADKVLQMQQLADRIEAANKRAEDLLAKDIEVARINQRSGSSDAGQVKVKEDPLKDDTEFAKAFDCGKLDIFK